MALALLSCPLHKANGPEETEVLFRSMMKMQTQGLPKDCKRGRSTSRNARNNQSTSASAPSNLSGVLLKKRTETREATKPPFEKQQSKDALEGGGRSGASKGNSKTQWCHIGERPPLGTPHYPNWDHRRRKHPKKNISLTPSEER